MWYATLHAGGRLPEGCAPGPVHSVVQPAERRRKYCKRGCQAPTGSETKATVEHKRDAAEQLNSRGEVRLATSLLLFAVSARAVAPATLTLPATNRRYVD